MADAFIAPLGESLNAAALVLARELRRAGSAIELGDGSFRLKNPLKPPTRLRAHIVILGEDELQSGILTVKNFATGIQTKFLARSWPVIPRSHTHRRAT